MKEIRVKYGTGSDIEGKIYYTTNYVGIQKAIKYAHSKGGGNIFIEKGVYPIYNSENSDDGIYGIKLYSNITLSGEGHGTILKPTFSTDGTDVKASILSAIGSDSKAILENITIKNLVLGNKYDDEMSLVGYIGIHCKYVGSKDKRGITIKNCFIQNNKETGINMENCYNNIIYNNNICYSYHFGIHLNNCSNTSISNNSCNNIKYGTGIYVEGTNENYYNDNRGNGEGYDNIINNNIVTHNPEVGINLLNTCKNNIHDNICMYNSRGIDISRHSEKNTIANNNTSENTNMGIALTSACHNIIRGNICSRNEKFGIYLGTNCDNNNLLGNNCYENNFGIDVEGSNDIITGNVCIKNNKTNIVINPSYNIEECNITD